MANYRVKISCKFCKNARTVTSHFRHVVGDTLNWPCPCKKPEAKEGDFFSVQVGSSQYTVVSCNPK